MRSTGTTARLISASPSLLELEVYDFNPRAIHVYEKAGFVREGVRRDVLLWDGVYQSAIVMSILKPEYEQRAIV